MKKRNKQRRAKSDDRKKSEEIRKSLDRKRRKYGGKYPTED